MPQYRLFLVADGMGGHKAGDVASRMATHAIGAFFRETEGGADQTWPFHFDPHRSTEENRLITSIKLANRRIFDASVRHREVQGMGTTLVGALFDRRMCRLYVAHVGDSRAYRYRRGALAQLTKDHSLVNDYLAAMPHMSEEQKQELPKNVITRALGMQDTVEVDVTQEHPQADDIYLLCSDGLSGMVSDETMRDVLEEHAEDLEQALQKLISLANEAGGEDNITAVAVRFSGAFDDFDIEGDTDAALEVQEQITAKVRGVNSERPKPKPKKRAGSENIEEADTITPDGEPAESEGRDPEFETLADDKKPEE